MYWYSKGTLGQSTWSLTRKRSTQTSIVSETGSRCGIDLLISKLLCFAVTASVSEIRCDCCCEISLQLLL